MVLIINDFQWFKVSNYFMILFMNVYISSVQNRHFRDTCIGSINVSVEEYLEPLVS
jgi:hypothetical protein